MKNYYRRVWEWKGSAWVVVGQGYIEHTPFPGTPPPASQLPCVTSVDYPTAGCSIGAGGQYGDPYRYEIWWEWVPSTWGGGGGGSWKQAASGGNWK